MKRNDRLGGFTLIEVLLAAMIVAFMGGTLYATFAAGFKLDRRIQQSFHDLDESRIVIAEIQRDLGRVVLYDFRGSFPEQKSFIENDDALMFVIDDGRGLRWVRYRVAAPGDGKIQSTELGTTSKKNIAVSNVKKTEKVLQTLVREEGDFVQLLNSSPSLTPDKSEVLTKRIADKGWEIFFAPSLAPQAKVEWQNDWKEDDLPAGVRIGLSLQNEKGQIKKTVSDVLLPAGGHSEK